MVVSEARAASQRSQCSCSNRGSRQLDATICISRHAQPQTGHVPAGEGTRLSAAGCASLRSN